MAKEKNLQRGVRVIVKESAQGQAATYRGRSGYIKYADSLSLLPYKYSVRIDNSLVSFPFSAEELKLERG